MRYCDIGWKVDLGKSLSGPHCLSALFPPNLVTRSRDSWGTEQIRKLWTPFDKFIRSARDYTRTKNKLDWDSELVVIVLSEFSQLSTQCNVSYVLLPKMMQSSYGHPTTFTYDIPKKHEMYFVTKKKNIFVLDHPPFMWGRGGGRLAGRFALRLMQLC